MAVDSAAFAAVGVVPGTRKAYIQQFTRPSTPWCASTSGLDALTDLGLFALLQIIEDRLGGSCPETNRTPQP